MSPDTSHRDLHDRSWDNNCAIRRLCRSGVWTFHCSRRELKPSDTSVGASIQDVDKYEEDSPSDALPVKNFWKLVENSMRLLFFWQVARSGAQLTIGWLKMAMFLVCWRSLWINWRVFTLQLAWCFLVMIYWLLNITGRGIHCHLFNSAT